MRYIPNRYITAAFTLPSLASFSSFSLRAVSCDNRLLRAINDKHHPSYGGNHIHASYSEYASPILHTLFMHRTSYIHSHRIHYICTHAV